MHSLGTQATLHRAPHVADILVSVAEDWRRGIREAEERGVRRQSIALDPGIGFGKSFEQNLELIAKLDALRKDFAEFPVLIGTSRKSFIGRLLNDAPSSERLHGTMASIAAAALKGAHVVRVHDVRAAQETLRIIDAIKSVTSAAALV